MITLNKIQDDLMDAIAELESGIEKCQLKGVSTQRHKDNYSKRKEMLNTAKINITLPDAEKNAIKQREELLSKIDIIDLRWEQGGNKTYRIPDNPNALLSARKNHHHSQYEYAKLKKQAEYLNYIINETKL